MAITTEIDNVAYNYALSYLTEMMTLTVMTLNFYKPYNN